MEIGGLLDQSKNPMLNHVVLERLFRVTEFDTKTFGTYRLVCKQWKEVSLLIWREKALLPVTSIGDGSTTGVYFQEYTQLLQEGAHGLQNNPFRRYIIRGWHPCIDSNTQEYSERRLFWEKVGPLMTHLHIKRSTFGSTLSFTQIIFELTKNLKYLNLAQNYYMHDQNKKDHVMRMDPQLIEHQHPPPPPTARKTVTKTTLQELRVEIKDNVDFLGHEDEIQNHGQLLPLTWMELLINFPNLRVGDQYSKIKAFQIVNVSLAQANSNTEMVKILTNMETIRNSKGSQYFANMEQLLMSEFARYPDFLPQISEDFVPHLRLLKFPLKVLSLNLGIQTKEKVLQQLLEIHSETLQHLILCTGYRLQRLIAFPNFPFSILFPNLKKLRLSGNIVANFRFLKVMPNLEILIIERAEIPITKFAELNAQHVVLQNMKEFQVDTKHFTDGQLVSLGKLMPNLTKLCVGLESKSGLKTVCNVWKELIHLNLNPLRSEDNAFMNSTAGIRYFISNVVKLKYRKSFRVGFLQEAVPKINCE